MKKERLKEARFELELTQSDMAEKLNTPLRTYQRWEYNGSMPGVVEVAVIYILYHHHHHHKQG